MVRLASEYEYELHNLLTRLGLKDLCSHRRSWRFWAESVAGKDTPTFHSVKSKSWSDFKKHRVDESYIIQMGLNCPETYGMLNYYVEIIKSKKESRYFSFQCSTRWLLFTNEWWPAVFERNEWHHVWKERECCVSHHQWFLKLFFFLQDRGHILEAKFNFFCSNYYMTFTVQYVARYWLLNLLNKIDFVTPRSMCSCPTVNFFWWIA